MIHARDSMWPLPGKLIAPIVDQELPDGLVCNWWWQVWWRIPAEPLNTVVQCQCMRMGSMESKEQTQPVTVGIPQIL